MFVSAQVSPYPLRQDHLSPVIDDALDILLKRGLEVSPGAISSVASGDDEALFAAIGDVFRKNSEQDDIVMVVTLSNACPVSR
jgi:uncharacterized protein YqgV (UPF0045/DUF77 family)